MHWTAETTNLTRVASLSITLSGVIKHLRVLPQADPRGSGETQEPLLSPVGAVLPLVDAPVEVVPGLWDQRSAEGYAYVVPKESEAYSEEGSPIAAVVDAVAEQAFCRACGHFDAAAWVKKGSEECKCPKGQAAAGRCERCNSATVKSWQGACLKCSKNTSGGAGRGGVALLVAGMLCYMVLGMVEQSVVGERIYHIVETPGALDLLAEEGPTDEYYNRLRRYMGKKFPGASGHLLDHLEALESFLDRSIAVGMTFGIGLCGRGRNISRKGAKCSAEKTRAILKFPALKEKLHIQQFLGCTNFLRSYLPPEYAHCAKLLGECVKGAKPFPDDGLGPGTSEGDLAVRAIKLIAQRSIELAVLDEAAEGRWSRSRTALVTLWGVQRACKASMYWWLIARD